MHIILLSGGSGKRLWPLSNDVRSKQFIKLFQTPDGEYESMVQCAYGRIYQVVLNCNPESEQFGKWQAFILSSENRHQVFSPPMFGNGFYVLSDVAVYSYKQTTQYGDAKQFTYKWNDPRFGIVWPDEHPILSVRDR